MSEVRLHAAPPEVDVARLRPHLRDRVRLVMVRRCLVCGTPTTGLRCASHAEERAA